MKQKLVKELEILRNTRIIDRYKFDVARKTEGNRECAVLTLTMDGVEVVNRQMTYNPEKQRFGKVVDLLIEQTESQLLTAGIMALYSNRKPTKIDLSWNESDARSC